MSEIYEELDKYNDGILKRSDFVMALRTDEWVVMFIDADAVWIPTLRKWLNIDDVLRDIE
jgi:hypothetical protein